MLVHIYFLSVNLHCAVDQTAGGANMCFVRGCVLGSWDLYTSQTRVPRYERNIKYRMVWRIFLPSHRQSGVASYRILQMN